MPDIDLNEVISVEIIPDEHIIDPSVGETFENFKIHQQLYQETIIHNNPNQSLDETYEEKLAETVCSKKKYFNNRPCGFFFF